MEEIIFHHVVVSFISAIISIPLLLFFFKIFRVRKSATRTLFIYLALLKPFLALILGIPDMYVPANRFAMIGFRMPDPLNLFPSHLDIGPNHPSLNMKIVNTTVLVTIILIAVSLLYRWIGLALFYRKLAHEEKVDVQDCPDIFSILDELVPIFKVPFPEIVLTHKTFQGPFTIGFWKPVIVLSPEIIESLSIEKLKMILAHELAHIKRGDYFSHWIALISRDAQFFNPFVHISYNWLSNTREKACDELCIEKMEPYRESLAEALIKACEMLKSDKSKRVGVLPDRAYTSLLKQASTLEKRVSNIIHYEFKKRKSSFSPILRKSVLCSFFFALLYVQFFVAMPDSLIKILI